MKIALITSAGLLVLDRVADLGSVPGLVLLAGAVLYWWEGRTRGEASPVPLVAILVLAGVVVLDLLDAGALPVLRIQ